MIKYPKILDVFDFGSQAYRVVQSGPEVLVLETTYKDTMGAAYWSHAVSEYVLKKALLRAYDGQNAWVANKTLEELS